MTKVFSPSTIKKLYQPSPKSSGEQNGQVTIIGGSKLFHGAPILSLKAASRIVDMVFFATPEPPVGRVAERIKSQLTSFIWIPWNEVEEYIKKSDAVLIGPGFMSFRSEKDRSIVEETKKITKNLLKKFPKKRWVIDAGSLQVMETAWIPKGAVLTPNGREFEMLFGNEIGDNATRYAQNEIRGDKNRIASDVLRIAKKFDCTIVLKGPETIVCSTEECLEVKGGNAGLTKGGTGDILAGLTVALLAKNEPFLAACSASYVAKATADKLYKKVGTNYNADDLANMIPKTLHRLTS